MIRGRFVWTIGLVALLSGTVGCSAAPVSATPTPAVTSPTSSASTVAASSTPPAAAPGLTVVTVPGYTYSEAPAQLDKTFEAMSATGMVSSTIGRSVKEDSGAEVGAVVLMQYNPKLTALLDKQDPGKILDGAVLGAKAMVPGKTTVTSKVLSGSQVRVVQGDQMSLVVLYKHGGHLVQVIGPAPAPLLAFAGAYLAASAE